MITYEDFRKVELKIATIKEAKLHPNADKLYVVTVDINGVARQVVAGIRLFYTPRPKTAPFPVERDPARKKIFERDKARMVVAAWAFRPKGTPGFSPGGLHKNFLYLVYKDVIHKYAA